MGTIQEARMRRVNQIGQETDRAANIFEQQAKEMAEKRIGGAVAHNQRYVRTSNLKYTAINEETPLADILPMIPELQRLKIASGVRKVIMEARESLHQDIQAAGFARIYNFRKQIEPLATEEAMAEFDKLLQKSLTTSLYGAYNDWVAVAEYSG